MDKKATIEKEASELINSLGVDCTVDLEEAEGVYTLQINSEADAPILIGKYGDTLTSLQIILEAIFFKIFNEPVKLVVNVNDYRDRQKERIEKIAQNVAERVVADKQEQSLRSFSAFERKIIHQYISDNFTDLTSYSEGEGADRKIVITIKS